VVNLGQHPASGKRDYRAQTRNATWPAEVPLFTDSGTAPTQPTLALWAMWWTALGWQGFSSRVQQWSEQPCVRPVSAAHVTAAIMPAAGSGPGQIHAFDYVSATSIARYCGPSGLS
jgi:hypothetical protein